jgi:hypothetical protein
MFRSDRRAIGICLGILAAALLLAFFPWRAWDHTWETMPSSAWGLTREGSHLYPIYGIAAKGRFVMLMADHDSIGSVYACMDRVHVLGGGRCEITPGSLRPGRTNTLERKYDNVYIALEFKP